MRANARARTRGRSGLYAFLLAAVSCVLGLSFCLIKSPQAKSEAYLAMSVQAMAHNDNDTAASAAMEAVRLNPAASRGWIILSELLQKRGQNHAALRARSIAFLLQQNPGAAAPVYAMPAEFRLSLLAMKDVDAR